MPKQTKKDSSAKKASNKKATPKPMTEAEALAATLMAQAQQATEYKAKCPQAARSGGGRTPAENVLYPVPEGITPPYASTPDFELKGVTKDGIFAYLRTYSSGSKWIYKVTASGFKGESWKAARENMAAMKKALAEANAS